MAKKGDQWVEVNSKVEEKFRPIGDINVMNKDGTFNPEAMAKILEGTSGKVREKLLNNMVRSINESRFSKGSFNLAKENLAKAPETSVDPKTGEIITKYITKDGEVIFSKTKRQGRRAERKACRSRSIKKGAARLLFLIKLKFLSYQCLYRPYP